MKRKMLFCFGMLILTIHSMAQVSGRVYDSKTGAPLAFVNVVIEGVQSGTTSDIDGRFKVPSARQGEILIFTFVGYKKKTWQVSEVEAERMAVRIEMETEPVQLLEAVVFPGENPAERIMRRAIANKDLNNPEKCCPFTYDSYNKLVFTGLIDSTVAGNPEKIAALDTSDQKAYDFFENQHLLLMESISERRFIPPGHSSEEVKASRISGLSNPDFVLLGTQLQSFSFYDDEISLLDYRYLSPMQDGAIRRYLYIIEDTTYQAADTVFILSFRPRSGKNFKGMKGLLYINTNGYALENVLAQPADGSVGGMDIRIRQHYEYIDGRQWFPVQLNTDIIFKNAYVGPFEVIGIGRSYLKNIRLDAPLRRRDVGSIALRMDPLSTRQPNEFWQAQRFDSLDHREAKTYTFMDSLSKAENFDRKYQWLQNLAAGRVNWGLIDFDLTHLMRFNGYEGFRLGGGLRTSDQLMKRVSLGGYAAYGFRDKEWKWGTDITWKVRPRSATELKVATYTDVFERGGQSFPDETSWLSDKGYYLFFVNQMDRLSVGEISFKTRLPAYLTVSGAYRRGALQNNLGYAFTGTQSNEGVSVNSFPENLGIQEAELNLRWSHREVLYQTTSNLIQAGTKNPVLGASVTVGEVNATGVSSQYIRTGVSAEHTFRMPMLGNFTFFAHAGKLFGDAPALRMYNFRSSRQMWSVAAPFSFETIEPGTQLADEYAVLHLRHNFRDLLYRGKWFKPQFVLVHNMAIGRLNPNNRHLNLNVTAPEHGHVESGLEIQNIIRSGFTGVGLGAYYRYGAANVGDFQHDFVVKLVIGFVF